MSVLKKKTWVINVRSHILGMLEIIWQRR